MMMMVNSWVSRLLTACVYWGHAGSLCFLCIEIPGGWKKNKIAEELQIILGHFESFIHSLLNANFYAHNNDSKNV